MASLENPPQRPSLENPNVHSMKLPLAEAHPEPEKEFWVPVAPPGAFPENGGACVKVGELQIAVFNFARRGEWYACQNLCPHQMQMILSRGMLGSASGIPKIACPYHKSTFSLETGECLNADLESIETYAVKVEDEQVFIQLSQPSS